MPLQLERDDKGGIGECGAAQPPILWGFAEAVLGLHGVYVRIQREEEKKRERKVDKEHGMRYKYREEEIVIKIQKQRERRVGK